MENNFFVKKKSFYKKFTRSFLIVVLSLFLLKNLTKSINYSSVLDSIILTNFPNPFSDITYIFINLPENNQINDIVDNRKDVSLKIFDLFGNLVKSYSFDDNVNKILVIWDGKDSNGNKVARGGYICVLYYSDVKIVRKIGLLN